MPASDLEDLVELGLEGFDKVVDHGVDHLPDAAMHKAFYHPKKLVRKARRRSRRRTHAHDDSDDNSEYDYHRDRDIDRRGYDDRAYDDSPRARSLGHGYAYGSSYPEPNGYMSYPAAYSSSSETLARGLREPKQKHHRQQRRDLYYDDYQAGPRSSSRSTRRRSTTQYEPSVSDAYGGGYGYARGQRPGGPLRRASSMDDMHAPHHKHLHAAAGAVERAVKGEGAPRRSDGKRLTARPVASQFFTDSNKGLAGSAIGAVVGGLAARQAQIVFGTKAPGDGGDRRDDASSVHGGRGRSRANSIFGDSTGTGPGSTISRASSRLTRSASFQKLKRRTTEYQGTDEAGRRVPGPNWMLTLLGAAIGGLGANALVERQQETEREKAAATGAEARRNRHHGRRSVDDEDDPKRRSRRTRKSGRGDELAQYQSQRSDRSRRKSLDDGYRSDYGYGY